MVFCRLLRATLAVERWLVGKKDGNESVVAHVAQLAEHVLGKDEVIGSNPIMGSIFGAGGPGWADDVPLDFELKQNKANRAGRFGNEKTLAVTKRITGTHKN